MNEQMEHEYKDALDGLRFSCERKEQIMKNLVEQQGKTSAKRRSIRPLRAALIAACLVLALVGSAVAVGGLAGVRIIDFFNDEPRVVNEGWEPEIYSGYVVQGDITYYPMDALAPEVAEIGRNAGKAIAKSFSSWESLEQFIGVNLMDNSVLAEAPSGIKFNVMGNGKNVSEYLAIVNVSDGNVPRIVIMGSYLLHPGKGSYGENGCIRVELRADLYTENASDPEYDTHSAYFPEGTEVSCKEYSTTSGLSAKIFRIDRPEREITQRNTETGMDEVVSMTEPQTDYCAEFSLNGVMFALDVSDCDDVDFLYTTVLEILDGFTV